MSQSTFKLHENHSVLTQQVENAINLSNTHHRISAYDLVGQFTQILCGAKTAWEAILIEINEIIEELPDKEYVGQKWLLEYKRLAVQIADAIALMICTEYAKGRAILEAEINPLQNIHAQITSALFEYEHAA
jgi:hypothetical protein